MTKPMSPDDINEKCLEEIPDEVFYVFNELIAKHWNGTYARFDQDEAVSRISSELDLYRDEVFARKLLDVEDIYRNIGWVVEYDKPRYNETYAANFKFSKKAKIR